MSPTVSSNGRNAPGADHAADHSGLGHGGCRNVVAQVARQYFIEAIPRHGLDGRQSGHLRRRDGRDITASRCREPAGLAQQLGAVADAQHQAVHAAHHPQHPVEAVDLFFLPLALRLGLRLADGPAHGGREARQVLLQYIVDGAGAQRRDRALLANGAGDEHEGNLRPQLLHHLQCGHAVELRQREIRQHDGGFEVMQRDAQRLLGFHALAGAAEAITLQLAELALHVDVEILDEEHSDWTGLLVSHPTGFQRPLLLRLTTSTDHPWPAVHEKPLDHGSRARDQTRKYVHQDNCFRMSYIRSPTALISLPLREYLSRHCNRCANTPPVGRSCRVASIAGDTLHPGRKRRTSGNERSHRSCKNRARACERSEPHDLVITDSGMPCVDGRKVAAAIQSLSPTTPVILLTGWGQRFIAARETPAHVDKVLGKPPKLGELRAAFVELTA
jgi:CheY-like chemotaxis protein